MLKPETITARAAVNLNGLRAGETATVDPTEPRIAALLKADLLVDEEPIYAEPPATAETPQERESEPGDRRPERDVPKPRARRTASEDSTGA